jgi:phage terminase small subunit
MTTPRLQVVETRLPATAGRIADESEIPKPQKLLTAAEKPVWNYVCKALKEQGLIHRTDVMALHVIVTTFVRWVDAEQFVERLQAETGTYVVTTRNGYEQPHQMFFVARNLKRDLLQWLPEACLTIPSFQKVKKLQQGDGNQGDLFANELGAFVASKPYLVSGGP